MKNKASKNMCFFIFTLICFFSCSTELITVKFNDNDKTDIKKLDHLLSYDGRLNNNYLVFLGSFNFDSISIFENDKLIEVGSNLKVVNYGDKAVMYYKINRDSLPLFKLNDINLVYKFDETLTHRFKFIYVIKKKNKIIVDYNNGTRLTDYGVDIKVNY